MHPLSTCLLDDTWHCPFCLVLGVKGRAWHWAGPWEIVLNYWGWWAPLRGHWIKHILLALFKCKMNFALQKLGRVLQMSTRVSRIRWACFFCFFPKYFLRKVRGSIIGCGIAHPVLFSTFYGKFLHGKPDWMQLLLAFNCEVWLICLLLLFVVYVDF